MTDFDYELPRELIAQTPAFRRDESRLLILERATGSIRHGRFPALLEFLSAGDTMVLNDSKVIPARLRAVNARTGGRFEILLLEEVSLNEWWVMMRPGKRARIGTSVRLLNGNGNIPVSAEVLAVNDEGHRKVRFTGVRDIKLAAEDFGEMPLPPYIRLGGSRSARQDRERYQTVFAEKPGSIAAPTAGLHFTPELLAAIEKIGVSICRVTLHVGMGTFAPVKADNPDLHIMHEERYEVSAAAASAINEASLRGGKVIAVGTTSLRVLESAANPDGPGVLAGAGRTRLFVRPPHSFRVAEALLTNFHLPRSTLLMLVSAFAGPGRRDGIPRIQLAYREAIRMKYRFFSYGDAMLIL